VWLVPLRKLIGLAGYPKYSSTSVANEEWNYKVGEYFSQISNPLQISLIGLSGCFTSAQNSTIPQNIVSQPESISLGLCVDSRSTHAQRLRCILCAPALLARRPGM
jgi:hypothetical protein